MFFVRGTIGPSGGDFILWSSRSLLTPRWRKRDANPRSLGAEFSARRNRTNKVEQSVNRATAKVRFARR